MRKKCVECKEWLHIRQFSIDKTRTDGYKEVCRGCFSERRASYPSVVSLAEQRAKDYAGRRREHKQIQRDYRRARFAELFEKQNGHCRFCDVVGAHLIIDGDSQAALLCASCRYALGVYRKHPNAPEPFASFLKEVSGG